MTTAPQRRSRLRRPVGALALLGALVVALTVTVTGGTARAATYGQLNGDGSTWAQPAIDQYSRDVRTQGLVVNFSPDGSASGRQKFQLQAVDYAATDIAYLTTADPFAGTESPPQFPYSYVPIVAGGTSFMYNLVVGGKKITDLRLSGQTLAEIFTGKIHNWNDKAITADYGRQLPSQQITVVTRSDGSGASFQFSRYLARVYPKIWGPFCTAQGGRASGGVCGPTEFYPGKFAGSVQRGGSDQVASYIANTTGEGSIGYDEYSYALTNGIPVVKLRNAAGYYTLPTPSNVAIALQAAVIDENPASQTFLIQNLDHVYTNPDKRTYPLSSYSYLIVPRISRPGVTDKDDKFLADPTKGPALSHFLNYVLCSGQQKAGRLGYSPLPENLFDGGFKQVAQIPNHQASDIPNPANYDNCNNPTYHNRVNFLLRDAPFPSPCDYYRVPASCSGGNPGAGISLGRSTTGGGTTGGGSTGGSTGSTGATKSTTVDPTTGQLLGNTGTDDGTSNAANVTANPVALGAAQGTSGVFATMTALELLAAVALPAGIGLLLRRRNGRT